MRDCYKVGGEDEQREKDTITQSYQENKMKFKEMSWEELKKDFRRILDKYTTRDLVDSLKKYKMSVNDKK